MLFKAASFFVAKGSRVDNYLDVCFCFAGTMIKDMKKGSKDNEGECELQEPKMEGKQTPVMEEKPVQNNAKKPRPKATLTVPRTSPKLALRRRSPKNITDNPPKLDSLLQCPKPVAKKPVAAAGAVKRPLEEATEGPSKRQCGQPKEEDDEMPEGLPDIVCKGMSGQEIHDGIRSNYRCNQLIYRR
jgi:hypothetical protein